MLNRSVWLTPYYYYHYTLMHNGNIRWNISKQFFRSNTTTKISNIFVLTRGKANKKKVFFYFKRNIPTFTRTDYVHSGWSYTVNLRTLVAKKTCKRNLHFNVSMKKYYENGSDDEEEVFMVCIREWNYDIKKWILCLIYFKKWTLRTTRQCKGGMWDINKK